jgi:hypothetical protein
MDSKTLSSTLRCSIRRIPERTLCTVENSCYALPHSNMEIICFPCVVFYYSSVYGCCAFQNTSINNLNNVAHINFTKSWLRAGNLNIIRISRYTTLSVAVDIAAYNIPLCQTRERLHNYLKLYKFRAIVFYKLVLFPTTAKSLVVCSCMFRPPIVAIEKELQYYIHVSRVSYVSKWIFADIRYTDCVVIL